MEINEMKIKMRAVREERETLSKKIRAMAAEVFAEGVKGIFEKHPTLEYFSWNQYTPYFNDGDVCEFSVNRDYMTAKDINNEVPMEDFYLSDVIGNIERGTAIKYVNDPNATPDRWGYRPQKRIEIPFTPTPLELAAPDIMTFVNEFEDDDFLMMFGDHVTVTITRDGKVETDTYDHE
jgi:hypothetical protein